MGWKKVVAVAVGLLAVGGGAGAAYLETMKPAARPATAARFEATPARLERGRYLAEHLLDCLGCHSPRDYTVHGGPIVEGRKGAGAAFPDEMGLPGRVVAPNITPDPETGIGAWSDDEVARAIREGVSRDGTALFPIMPYRSYRALPDEDVAAIVVYLRSLAPVKNALPRTELRWPVRWFVKAAPKPITAPVEAPAFADPVTRGEWLVRVAACADCHTPQKRGRPIAGKELGGGMRFRGPWGTAVATNLTPDPTGIPYYTEDLFVKVMRTGNLGGRRIAPIMPWLAYRGLTDEDLRAMWAYLRQVPPVANEVERADVPAMKAHPDVREGS